MRYFVISRRFDGADSYSISADPPRLDTKEARNRTASIQLSARADKLSLDELVELYVSGELQKSKVWTVIRAPVAAQAGAKAFAKYREARTSFAPIHKPPSERDRKKERRRIIKKAQARRAAVVAIGTFCLEFGRRSATSNRKESS